MSGNEYIAAALQRIIPPVFAFAGMRMSKGHTFDLVEDAHSHSALVNAIKRKNPKLARTAFLTALDAWLASSRTHVFAEEKK
jgi:DNA-binding GntR family transcriptional regulator